MTTPSHPSQRPLKIFHRGRGPSSKPHSKGRKSQSRIWGWGAGEVKGRSHGNCGGILFAASLLRVPSLGLWGLGGLSVAAGPAAARLPRMQRRFPGPSRPVGALGGGAL